MPDLTGAGTTEEQWRRSGVLESLPRVGCDELVGTARVVLVAPHPDDEVLGAGGLLATLTAEGRDVTVVGVTDGEGSHPDSPTVAPGELAVRRRAERRAALAHLGVERAELLGQPDGAIDEQALTAALSSRLAPGDVLLAPRPGDGHPDHDATARAAAAAVSAREARSVGYGVWFWHHAAVGALATSAPGPVRFDPTDAARAAKSTAIAAFDSQLRALSDDPRDAPVLPSHVLARLDRSFEVFW